MGMDRLVGIFGLLFAVLIALRVLLVYRETGRMPILLNSGDAAHDYIHKVLAGIFVLEAANILAFRLPALTGHANAGEARKLYSYLGPFHSLETPALQAAGLAMAYLGLAWSVTAQHQMGRDWRIGIDYDHKTSLVTRGLYRVTRHPIYLGFMVICAGLFCATPNVLTLICAVLAMIILSVEARLEEAFLLSLHGQPYKQYLARTRRWI